MKIFLIVWSLFFTLSYSFGEGFSLENAYQEALKSNASLKVTYHKWLVAKEQTNQSYARLLPNVVATAGQNRYFSATTNNPSYANSPSKYTTKSYELRVTQPIINLPIHREYSKSNIALNISETEFMIAKQELMILVAQAYIDFLSSTDKLSLANAKVDTLSEQLADIKKRFELGDATVQDLSDTEAKYNIAVSQNMEAHLSKDLATAKFVEIVGKQPENLIQIIESPKYENINNKMEELYGLVFVNNQNLLAKKLNLEIAKENIISNKENFYPVVDAIGSINHYDTTDSISTIGYTSKQNYLGVQLTASLYSGGETTSKVIESQEKKNQALEEYDATKKELEYNVIKEYFGINTYVSQIKSYEMALKSSQTAIEAAKVGFSVGARTQYEVLQAIEQYYNVKNSLFDAKYKYILSSLKLKMLVGELDEEDFKNLDFFVK